MRSNLLRQNFGRRIWRTALALAAFLLSASTYCYSAAPGTTSATSELKAIAKALTGKLIIAGTTFYRVSHVQSIEESDGGATLRAEGDPLFEAEYSGNPDGNDGGRLYYDVRLPSKAACGAPNASTSIHTSNFLIFHHGQFVTLREAFKDAHIQSFDRPINRITPAILNGLTECAKQMAEIADAMPFRRIAIYAGSQQITEVTRTFTSSSTYEEGPGEELIANMSHVLISPRNARALDDFDVQVRAVSVMHCDYEGPHLELDGWKQGLGPVIELEREGQRFRMSSNVLASKMPPFPAYTKTELRQAIARQFGILAWPRKKKPSPAHHFYGAIASTYAIGQG